MELKHKLILVPVLLIPMHSFLIVHIFYELFEDPSHMNIPAIWYTLSKITLTEMKFYWHQNKMLLCTQNGWEEQEVKFNTSKANVHCWRKYWKSTFSFTPTARKIVVETLLVLVLNSMQKRTADHRTSKAAGGRRNYWIPLEQSSEKPVCYQRLSFIHCVLVNWQTLVLS